MCPATWLYHLAKHYFYVNTLSQLKQTPSTCHWKVVMHIVRYLKGTIDHGIMFRTTSFTVNYISLLSYSYADWGGDISDRKSVYGHYLLLNGNPIMWNSTKQSVLARSSAETEYRAIANAVCKIMWVKSLLIIMD